LFSTISLTGALALLGCKDSGITSPPDHNLLLSVQAAGSVLQKANHEILHLTSVKVLLKRIEFGQSESEDSVELESGLRVVNLAMDAKITELSAVRIRPGEYDRIRFTIHKPDDQEQVSDSAFIAADSTHQRFSVVITGFYHETPFTFRSQESAAQELRLVAPVNVTDDETINVTLKIDPYLWFTTNGLILDPFNQTKEINDLLTKSFADVFRDNNRDGDPD
jgi:hypothetical protein